MVQINFALKEVNCKIVYYGPGMSGKTTNLEVVHIKAPESNKGELTSIATEGDRTLFFDFMPLDLGNIAGMRTKFQLYTVPGQVYYNSTRKLVLQGVDGIIFVADSQRSKLEENLESMENLHHNLAEYGKDLNAIPLVIQYNKRDLPDVMSVEELDEHLNTRKVPSFEGIATTGEGVFPTLKALSGMVLESLSRDKRGAGPATARSPAPAPRAAAKAPAASPAAPAREPAKVQSIYEESFGPAAPRQVQPAAAAAAPAQVPVPLTPIAGVAMGPNENRAGVEGGAPIDGGPTAAMPASPSRAEPLNVQQRPPPNRYANEAPPGINLEPKVPAAAGGGQGSPHQTQRPAMSERSRQQDWERRERRSAGMSRGHQAHGRMQKFVIEDERGSPIVLFALVAITLLAVGVILYSFKMF